MFGESTMHHTRNGRVMVAEGGRLHGVMLKDMLRLLSLTLELENAGQQGDAAGLAAADRRSGWPCGRRAAGD